jgi:hypothetical protein
VGERLLALTLLAASGVYLAGALPLPHGTVARPGAGFFPVAVGVFGAAVALVWVMSAFWRAPATVGAGAAGRDGLGRVGATAGALVGFCLLLPWTGYPVAAFAFAGLVLRRLGASWAAALATALASAVVSYYLFGVLLGVPLPRGVLMD